MQKLINIKLFRSADDNLFKQMLILKILLVFLKMFCSIEFSGYLFGEFNICTYIALP